jgi:AcrR family transcriptional regulator
MSEAVKRPYDSTRRQEQAQDTRRRIIAAARELFVDQGYATTTMVQIAERAGVAVETVYGAFRNKATLLRQVWYVDFRGDEDDLPLYDRAEMHAILAEADLATRIRRHAVFVTGTNRRMSMLVDMLTGAAALEPAAAAMLAEWADRRIDVATRYAQSAADTGQLAVTEDHCRDVLFATMDGALWQRLVVARGWTDAQYADWLGQLWVDLFVVPTSDPRQEPS